MKIETMEPETQSRPTSMERITAAADVAGAPRAEKVMQILGRILGAPEAAGMAITIAGENVRELQLRTADRLNESAHWLEDQLGGEIDRLGQQMTDLKDKGVNKAKDLGLRAVKMGLTAFTRVEDKVVAVCQTPAVLLEKVAGGYEKKAAVTAGELAQKAVEQGVREMNLNAEQAAILARILAAQAAERGEVSAKHERVAEKIQGKIESAKGKAVELKTDAGNIRGKVEGWRIFKGLLAKVGA